MLPQMPTTTAPAIMPASAPMEVSLRQNSDSRMMGPKAAPKPAQAKATRPRIFERGSIASSAATTATASTPRRPSMTWACADRFLPKILYRSSTSAEEHTSNWEETVDMIAASTAASTRPAMKGWNRICDSSRNTVSGLSSVCSVVWKKPTPISPVNTAPAATSTIQPIPMRRPALASAEERMAMKRTMMCGWPK